MSVEAMVAEVLSAFEIAINVGSDDGVSPGDRATVLRVVEVRDPSSREPLGQVRRPLVRLYISEVQERLAIGRVTDSIMRPVDARSVLEGRSGPRRIRKRVTADPVAVDSETVLVPIGTPVIVEEANVEEEQ